LCGNHAVGKKIHPIFFESAKYLGPMMKGYFLGDGCIRKENIVASTASPHLAYQVRNILAANNILCSLKEYKVDDGLDKFIMGLYGESHDRFCQFTEIQNGYSDQKKNRGKRFFENENFFFAPIKKIVSSGCGKVLDIQVEGSKSFTANGILVHNSVITSLACGTPMIVNKTGGMTEQITDGVNVFGVGIEPVSKSVIGSQDVPYIFEDRLAMEDVVQAMVDMFEMPKEKREELGRLAMEHVDKNFNFGNYKKRWVEIFDEVIEKNGSWDTRKNYRAWAVLKI